MSVSPLLGTLRKPMFSLPCSIMLPADVPAVGTENKTYLSSHANPRISIMPQLHRHRTLQSPALLHQFVVNA